mgnify:CR=1 FL=1
MEKDINTEVSNTQLPATEEKANLKESLRIQKSQWIKEQIKRQREAEDAVLEQMIEEQRVIDGLNSDINENLDRTRESRKFNQEFQEKINTQIYEMNGITEDKLKGMREYKNAYYQGCAFSLFLLSVVMIGICGVLHGFESQICLFMIACTGVEGALLAQDIGNGAAQATDHGVLLDGHDVAGLGGALDDQVGIDGLLRAEISGI